MIRDATLFWLLLVVLGGAGGAVIASGNYPVRALEGTLGRILDAASQERRNSGLPARAGGQIAAPRPATAGAERGAA